jgi:TPR repeat protein
MFRPIALLFICCALFCLRADAQDAGKSELGPVYEGAHVLPLLYLPRLPEEFKWSDRFDLDTSIVLTRYGWYVAEIVAMVDESGQVRDAFVAESLPSRNLSATIVGELRRHKFPVGASAEGPVPAQFAFRIKYYLRQYHKNLTTVATRLRREAAAGDAGAQYILSQAMLGAVGFNKEGLDSDELLRTAADPGGDRRAMLALGLMRGNLPEGKDPVAVVAERRGWLLKAAEKGSGSAQVLVALDSWAEQTAAGHARARYWLERAVKAEDPSAPKYLAALLVSHSSGPEDWKTAHEQARVAARGWHGQKDPDLWQILAATSALTGDFPGALEAQHKAIALAAEAKWSPELLERRLASYRDSRIVTDEIVVVPRVARTVTTARPRS